MQSLAKKRNITLCFSIGQCSVPSLTSTADGTYTHSINGFICYNAYKSTKVSKNNSHEYQFLRIVENHIADLRAHYDV